MKVLLSWLSEFVTIPKQPDQELAKKIAEHCFEVEKILYPSAQELTFTEVYAAKVLSAEKHPNADRLRVVRLELEPGKIVEPVVCGAFNFEAGDSVALALPGAFIPHNVHSDSHESYVLSTAKIRGIESQGMICSAFELGVNSTPESKPEILVLDKAVTPGTDLHFYFANSSSADNAETVFDFALPANRPDLHSHLGIAREFSNILGYRQTSRIAEAEKTVKFKPTAPKTLKVKNEFPEGCRFYFAARMRVKVGPSPDNIKERLEALGLRSINNIVDITNYVMHQIGEPTHAYDAKKIEGQTIMVRRSKAGEKIVTIDHKERILPEGSLVIADEQKALAIGGIMGGLESEVSGQTTEIIFEAANFEPTTVRSTSKKLGIRTSGSMLWEKNLRIEQALIGAAKGIELLEKHAGGEIIEYGMLGKIPEKQATIAFTANQVNGIIGSDYSVQEIKKILSGTALKISGSKGMSAHIPYYRTDMENYADIADEIIRITGLNLLEKQPLEVRRTHSIENQDRPFFEMKQHMVEAGFFEVQNYSFISSKDLADFGLTPDGFVKITNPLSVENEFMKKHLLIPLLRNIAHNLKHEEKVNFFEIGKGYYGYLQEKNLMTFVMSDKNAHPEDLLMRAKGIVAWLLSRYFEDHAAYKEIKGKNLADILIADTVVGNMGPVSAKIQKAFGIGYPVVYVKFDLDQIFSSSKPQKYAEYSHQPQSTLDISLVVRNQISWQEIEAVVRNSATELLQEISLFEAPTLYPKNKIPKFHTELLQRGFKNLAFRLIFSAKNRTLTAYEISPIYDKIIGELKSKLAAEIR